MCNIAGYIGNQQAAPVLIEMMKQQEGYCGGYYTGITTLHEGKLYHAKVLGAVDKLLSQTNAIHFPGNVGVIHSRSASGGDWHWGHPFTSEDDTLSVVLNGAKGKYSPLCDASGAARFISELGANFETQTPYCEAVKIYPVLPNGNCVHYSELMCLLTDYYKKQDFLPTHISLEKAFLRLPGEIVSLALQAQDPGTISFAKYNMPMSVARTADEVFLGSFSICFPKDRTYMTLDELPAQSSGAVTLEETKIHRFSSILKIGQMTPDILHDAYDIILNTLEAKGRCTIGMLNEAVRVLWGDLVDLRYPATYSILRKLDDDGKLFVHRETVPGMTPELTAPKFTVSLNA